MDKVVSINRTRRVSSQYAPQQTFGPATHPAFASAPPAEEKASRVLAELDGLSSRIMVRVLRLQHQKEADMRSWAAQEAELAAELESAAYEAFLQGVPEEAIYDLQDEALSNALNAAMRKVASA